MTLTNKRQIFFRGLITKKQHAGHRHCLGGETKPYCKSQGLNEEQIFLHSVLTGDLSRFSCLPQGRSLLLRNGRKPGRRRCPNQRLGVTWDEAGGGLSGIEPLGAQLRTDEGPHGREGEFGH